MLHAMFIEPQVFLDTLHTSKTRATEIGAFLFKNLEARPG